MLFLAASCLVAGCTAASSPDDDSLLGPTNDDPAASGRYPYGVDAGPGSSSSSGSPGSSAPSAQQDAGAAAPKQPPQQQQGAGDAGAGSASNDAGPPPKPPLKVTVGSKAIPVCADDITGNPSFSQISVPNPGNSFTGGFKGAQDGAGGINMFLTSYPVVKIYRASDVAAHKPATVVIDDMATGKAIKDAIANKTFSLQLTGLPPGSYLVAMCAVEAKDRCEMTHTYQDAQQEADAKGYDEPWQAFFNLNNKEGENRFGFIAGSDSPIVVPDAGTSNEVYAQGGMLMVLWSKSDGKSWEYICTDDGHGGSANISPLVLDLGGGAPMSSREDGVTFDLTDGQGARRISWPTGKDTYLLARDVDGNGNIDDGRELFGSYTQLEGLGYRAANGFEALAQFDVNRDGVIDARDPVYAELVAWSDVVRDGKAGPGELVHLPDLGVRAIDLRYTSAPEMDAFGNVTRERGGLTLDASMCAAKRTARVIDVWFHWE